MPAARFAMRCLFSQDAAAMPRRQLPICYAVIAGRYAPDVRCAAPIQPRRLYDARAFIRGALHDIGADCRAHARQRR